MKKTKTELEKWQELVEEGHADCMMWKHQAMTLRAALQRAEMAMLGYTHRNDAITEALKQVRAALTTEAAP